MGIVSYYVEATCGPRRLCQYLAESGMEVNDVSAIMHCPRVIAVAAVRILNGFGHKRNWARFLRSLMALERLTRLRTRFLTGFVMAL